MNETWRKKSHGFISLDIQIQIFYLIKILEKTGGHDILWYFMFRSILDCTAHSLQGLTHEILARAISRIDLCFL
jgi:hypothetical protein